MRKIYLPIFILLVTVHGDVLAAETVNYLHTDQLGSVSLVTDQTGEVVAQQSYYPYGNTRSYQLSVDSYQLGERQYTGQISDQNQTGLYYYNARYYNPTLAKFTQADTVNDGLNRYAYVGNNPINLTDPTGNCSLEPGAPDPCSLLEIVELVIVTKYLTNSQCGGNGGSCIDPKPGYQVKPEAIVLHWAHPYINPATKKPWDPYHSFTTSSVYNGLNGRSSATYAIGIDGIMQLTWMGTDLIAANNAVTGRENIINIEIAGADFDKYFDESGNITADWLQIEVNYTVSLIQMLMKQFNLTTEDIVGHRDLTPYKSDPGIKFTLYIKNRIQELNETDNQKDILDRNYYRQFVNHTPQ